MTISEPLASHQIWQLRGGCTHRSTCTHRVQVLQIPFPSWAVSDVPVGSIEMSKDEGKQSWDHPDGSWQVSRATWEGTWGGEAEATRTSPPKISYTCSHAQTQRWSEDNDQEQATTPNCSAVSGGQRGPEKNIAQDRGAFLRPYFIFLLLLLITAIMPCGSALLVRVCSTTAQGGEHWCDAELARKGLVEQSPLGKCHWRKWTRTQNVWI